MKTMSPLSVDFVDDDADGLEFGLDSEVDDTLEFMWSDEELDDELRRRQLRRPSRTARLASRRGGPAGWPQRPPPSRSTRPVNRRPLPPRWPRRRHPMPLRPKHRRPIIIPEPAPSCICPAHGTEFVRWVQSALNLILGTRLVVNGVMNRATRDGLRRFQVREGLVADGIAGPETEKALIASKAQKTSPQRELSLFSSALAGSAGYPLREPEEEFRFSDFPEAVLKRLRGGMEKDAVKLAVGFERRGENLLSDLVFFHRHPARAGRFLKKGEPNFNTLSREWLTIRDTIVRPMVAAAFFAEYELRFNPGPCSFCINANTKMSAAQKAQRRSDVAAVVGILLDRRQKRAVSALKRKLPALAPILRDSKPGTRFSRIQRLSSAQLALFREFFPTASGGINFGGFQFAFELFANGQLRNPGKGRGFGEPDGGFYFLFAEFAFLCIDAKVEKILWAKALKALVKTQEIFMHVYRKPPHVTPPPVGTGLPKPGPAVRKLEDYHFSNFNPAGRTDDSRKDALRAKYKRKGVMSLKRAARDNLLRAQRMP